MGAPSNDPGDMAAELLQARVIQQEEELQELQQEVQRSLHSSRQESRPRRRY